MRLTHLLTLCLLLILAAPLYAQSTDPADDDLLRQANANLLSAASFRYALSMTMSLPDGALQADGGGAYQSAKGGFLSFGSRSGGIDLNLTGSLDVMGTSTAFDMGAVVLGNTLYLNNGVDPEGWVQVPLAANASSLQNIAPTNADTSFLTVTRLQDTSIGAEAVAAYRMDYDLSDPTVQQAVAGATAGLPSLDGALATGEDAASLLDDADLTVIQYISLETQQVRRITVEFRLGETTLQLQADLSDYNSRTNIQPPANADAISPENLAP